MNDEITPLPFDENNETHQNLVNDLEKMFTKDIANGYISFNQVLPSLVDGLGGAYVDNAFNLIVKAWEKASGVPLENAQKIYNQTFNKDYFAESFEEFKKFEPISFPKINEEALKIHPILKHANENLKILSVSEKTDEKDDKHAFEKKQNIISTTFIGLKELISDIYEHISKTKEKYQILLCTFIYFIFSALKPIYLLIIGEKDIYSAGHFSTGNKYDDEPYFINYVSNLRFSAVIFLLGICTYLYLQYKEVNSKSEQ